MANYFHSCAYHPISLVGVFFIMYLMDFSINVLTLLGIVLSIGLVVDDAIVVLENIYTRIEKGENPLKAAEKGSEEIFFLLSSQPPLPWRRYFFP